MQVAKWGNSLAVRLPASLVQEMGLKEGDRINLRPAAPCGETAQAEVAREPTREELIEDLLEITKGWMPVDYKFDREEANAR